MSTFALVLANACTVRAFAAEAMLTVAISPEVAYLVREWRRANGLPQAPEAALPHAIADGRGAIEPAWRLLGIEDPSRSGRRILVVRHSAFWRVTIESRGAGPTYVVDVADSIASRTNF